MSNSLPSIKQPSKVFVFGAFNILHPGHLRLLRFAKSCGNSLTVGVLSDRLAGSSAYIPERQRLEGLVCNGWVDHAMIIDEPVTDIINRLQPAIVVKGKEHEHLYNSELAVLEKYGGQLLFSSGESTFSSIDLLRKEFTEANFQNIFLPANYMNRHRITPETLIGLVEKFSDVRVCVIGDIILDEYITCQPLGMSQEDPTLVVTPIDATCFLGGAGIVAAHGAGLGADVTFLSITGRDNGRKIAIESLTKAGVNSELFVDPNRPTTLKQRFRSKGVTLLRVSHLSQRAIDISFQIQILDFLKKVLTDTDLLVFSDFNYGCLPQPLVEQIMEIARQHNVMMVADSQSSSQIGDISRFKGMRLIFPTEREARLATRNSEAGLVVLAEQLRQQSDAGNVLMTLGEEGLLIHAAENDSWLTDRIPALNTSPKDVAGAGDSMLITSSLALAACGSIWDAALLGSLAAAIQVGRVGNSPIQLEEFFRELSRNDTHIGNQPIN